MRYDCGRSTLAPINVAQARLYPKPIAEQPEPLEPSVDAPRLLQTPRLTIDPSDPPVDAERSAQRVQPRVKLHGRPRPIPYDAESAHLREARAQAGKFTEPHLPFELEAELRICGGGEIGVGQG
jgi:hypothetical protein